MVANFDGVPHAITMDDLSHRSQFAHGRMRDLYSGEAPAMFNEKLVVPPRRFYWLSTRG